MSRAFRVEKREVKKYNKNRCRERKMKEFEGKRGVCMSTEKPRAMKRVCIYTAGDRIEAEMLLEALHRNRIQAYREASGSGEIMDVYTGNSIFGEMIFVDEQDEGEAREIVESILTQSEIEVQPGDEISDQTGKNPIYLKVFAYLFLFFLLGALIFAFISSTVL